MYHGALAGTTQGFIRCYAGFFQAVLCTLTGVSGGFFRSCTRLSKVLHGAFKGAAWGFPKCYAGLF